MVDLRPVLILGAGGHARVVLDCLRAAGRRAAGFLDAKPPLQGDELDGVPILGGDELMPQFAGDADFIVGMGDPAIRPQLWRRALSAGLTPAAIRHPSAVVSPSALVGAGTLIAPGVIVNAGARIGCDAILNSGALVEHDCVVEDHAHVAPRACLLGGASVGVSCHIGAGAVLREGVRVDEGAIVGAGSVVIRGVGRFETVAGVPAKPIRQAAG
jgi:UDP-perosamine 4-acetyltransferase